MTINLRNAETGGIYTTTDINGDGGEAQARIYEARGWERVPAAVIAAEAAVDHPVDNLDSLDDSELADVAVRNHIDIPPDATRDELVAAITERFPDPPPDLTGVDLDALTKAELADLADRHGIEGVSMGQTKDEMVDAITASTSSPTDDTSDDTNLEET